MEGPVDISLSVGPFKSESFPRYREFRAGKPWLLRFFDQIRFYPVSAEQLLQRPGRFSGGIQSEDRRVNIWLSDYHTF